MNVREAQKLETSQRLLEKLKVPGLIQVVCFFRETSLDFIDDLFGRMARDASWKHCRAQQHKVICYRSRNSGVLDFHGNLFAALCNGTVHLPQRGGGEWLSREFTEHLFRITADGCFKLCPGESWVHRRGAHLKIGQFYDRLRRQCLGLHAQELTQFHDRPFKRAEFLVNLTRSPPVELFLSNDLLTVTQQQILHLVGQVTSGEG